MSLYVFWGTWPPGKIEKIRSDGTDRQNLVTGLTVPQGIDVYYPSGHIYFVDRGANKIQRSDLDGSNIVDIVTSGMIESQGLKLDTINNKIIWIDADTDNIKRCNFDGSNIEVIVTGLGFGEDVDIDFNNEKIYWTDSDFDHMGRCDLDGSNQEIVLTGLNNPESLDIDNINDKIYFVNVGTNQIKKCNLDGSSLENVVSSLSTPQGLAINVKNNALAWSELGNGSNGTISIANLDGSSELVLATSLSTAQRVFIFDQSISGLVYLNTLGHNISSGQISLYMPGQTIEDNIDIFISGTQNMSDINDSINFIIDGIQSTQDSSCPILDPTASIQISSELIEIYQSRIDALINQLGKNILLEFDPIKDPCPNCGFDILNNRSNGVYKLGGPIPFSRGQKCPYCKAKGFLLVSVNKCIKALIKWNPREVINYGISTKRYNNIVRIKAFLTDSDDLSRAKTAIIDYDIADQFKQVVKLIKGPVPVGLREDRYCTSFWTLLDN